MWNMTKGIIQTCAYIVLGVEVAVAVFISIFYPGESLSVAVLWQILACSAVCALGNLIWWTKKQLSRMEELIRIFLHYLYINVVVFGSALMFDWIDYSNIVMVISLFFMILVLFIVIFLAVRYYYKKISDLMNRSLKTYQKQEGEKN